MNRPRRTQFESRDHLHQELSSKKYNKQETKINTKEQKQNPARKQKHMTEKAIIS